MNPHKPTILIVDDMAENLMLLSDILKEEYEIQVAKSAQKALTIIEKSPPDLLLLDVVMPEMDGYELCTLLKATPSTADIPIIFVTANSADAQEEQGFMLGAVDYITKPFKPTTIKSRVKTHVNLRLRQREIEAASQIMQSQNEKLKRYATLIDENVITSTTDLEGVILDVSTAFCRISGYSREELLGKKHNIVRHPDMPDSFYEKLWRTIIANKTWFGEIKNLKKDGGFYWVKAVISPLFEKGEKIGYTALRQDITDKKHIEAISITDGLTQIFNRRHFNETLPKIINSAKRKDLWVCFLILDIDFFKPYNDHYGHQEGDAVLIAFAHALKTSLNRADDLAFRLGGEEFGIIFDADDAQKAMQFANSVKSNIEVLNIPHAYSSVSDHITASMGLVCKKATQIKDTDALFKEADDLLYTSKNNGRNRITMNTQEGV